MSSFYLTFDVGIVNLAYCFAKYDKELTIIDWDIINFSQKKLLCNQIVHLKKSTRKCGKNATYTNKTNDNNFCDHHYKTKNERVSKIPDPNNFSLTNVSELIKSLDTLFLNVLTIPYDIDDNGKGKYAKKINIIIENQPPGLIQTMKSYSVIMYGFFAAKKIQYPNIISDVRFINAITKTSDEFILEFNKRMNINHCLLNVYKQQYIENHYNKFLIRSKNTNNNKELKYNKPKPYDIRKAYSVDFVAKITGTINTKNTFDILQKNSSNVIAVTNFELSKKKDDMSDTLLYVYHAIFIGIKNKNKSKKNKKKRKKL